jgi:hypothetical protein
VTRSTAVTQPAKGLAQPWHDQPRRGPAPFPAPRPPCTGTGSRGPARALLHPPDSATASRPGAGGVGRGAGRGGLAPRRAAEIGDSRPARPALLPSTACSPTLTRAAGPQAGSAAVSSRIRPTTCILRQRLSPAELTWPAHSSYLGRAWKGRAPCSPFILPFRAAFPQAVSPWRDEARISASREERGCRFAPRA